MAHFRTFRLPGGEQAIKEPRRSAVGLLYEIFGDTLFEKSGIQALNSFSILDRDVLLVMLRHGLHSPLTSSAGRLFDGVAALIGLFLVTRFEGQAAMALEYAAESECTQASYPFDVSEEGNGEAPVSKRWIVDWRPVLTGILDDLSGGESPGPVAAKFHNTLVEVIFDVARRVGEERVVLTGGCFQNRYLAEKTIQKLREEGFKPYWHQRIPPNDGGIALGQVAAAMRVLSMER